MHGEMYLALHGALVLGVGRDREHDRQHAGEHRCGARVGVGGIDALEADDLGERVEEAGHVGAAVPSVVYVPTA